MLAFIAACSNNANENANADSTTSSSTTSEPDISANPDYQKGLALVASSDCLTCHKISEKLTGPPYDSVANRYANTEENVKMLAEKIIKGGSGTWGTIAMTPHPAVSQADAEQMVKYILLLRTNK
jgi:cytochrome c